MSNKRSRRGRYNGPGNIISSFQIYYVTDFLKSTLIHTAYIFLRIVRIHFNKGRKQNVFSKITI